MRTRRIQKLQIFQNSSFTYHEKFQRKSQIQFSATFYEKLVSKCQRSQGVENFDTPYTRARASSVVVSDR